MTIANRIFASQDLERPSPAHHFRTSSRVTESAISYQHREQAFLREARLEKFPKYTLETHSDEKQDNHLGNEMPFQAVRERHIPGLTVNVP